MTPAEFDTKRRKLGLSIDEVARALNISPRTINRWMHDLRDVPHYAEDLLHKMEAGMRRAVDNARAMVKAQSQFVTDGPVPLIRYRTQAGVDAAPHAAGMALGAHAMLIAWTADDFAVEGIPFVIVWGD